MTECTCVSARGSVFISYRSSDGRKAAEQLAWLLRSAGIPVWHDESDLTSGDIRKRLEQALAGGSLVGAVLIITPDMNKSAVVRNVELPELLRLEQDPRFLLAVANLVRTDSGDMDITAPDRLLTQPSGTLNGFKQYPADGRSGMTVIVREFVKQRIRARAVDSTVVTPSRLNVSISTRSSPYAQLDQSHLAIQVRPPASGGPLSYEGCEDLKFTLPLLPMAFAESRARGMAISGNAHLSVACALGCALPTTLVTDVRVVASDGQEWVGATNSKPVGPNGLTLVVDDESKPAAIPGQRKSVVVYVDLLPLRSDAAYTRLLREEGHRFVSHMHIRPVRLDLLEPVDAPALTAEVSGRIRTLSQEHSNADVHLLLRTPFPIAVFLGRLLNTLTLTVYEWDATAAAGFEARYLRALQLTPSDAAGPITAVLLPKPLA